MNLVDARRYFKTVTKNIHTIETIPADKFIEFAECLFKEIEKEKNKDGWRNKTKIIRGTKKRI